MTSTLRQFVFALVALVMTSACGKVPTAPGPSGGDVQIFTNPNSVRVGETSVLSWMSKGSCVASGDWSGSKKGDGNQTVGPYNQDALKTFTLTCGGAVGTANLLVGQGSGNSGESSTSSDGLVTVTVIQRTPARGPLVPGPQMIRIHVTNRSDSSVRVYFDIFGSGSEFPPHSETDAIKGSSFGTLSGSVPVIRLTGKYGISGFVSWAMDITGWP